MHAWTLVRTCTYFLASLFPLLKLAWRHAHTALLTIQLNPVRIYTRIFVYSFCTIPLTCTLPVYLYSCLIIYKGPNPTSRGIQRINQTLTAPVFHMVSP
jgi:hypothetical protein